MSPVAIITGSDSGIGQESAKALAEAGNGGRAINITSVNQDPACSHRQNKPRLSRTPTRAASVSDSRGSGGALSQHFDPNLAVGTQAGAEVYSCRNRRISTRGRLRQQVPV
jgi:hypothetical protein